VNYQAQRTIDMFNPITIQSDNDYDAKSGHHAIKVEMEFKNWNIHRPQIHENNGAIKLMFPNEARRRNFTYASTTVIDIHITYTVRTGEMLDNVQVIKKVIKSVSLGKLPIMLHSDVCVLTQYKHFNTQQSGECEFDTGGYFIINGSEKVILGQERSAENKVYLFDIRKNNTKYLWTAEIRSVSHLKCISPKQIALLLSNKNNGFGHCITIELPRVKQPISLFIIFRILGVLSDHEICNIILSDLQGEQRECVFAELQATILDGNQYRTPKDEQPLFKPNDDSNVTTDLIDIYKLFDVKKKIPISEKEFIMNESLQYLIQHVTFTPINMDKETGIRKKEEFAHDIIKNDLFPHCHNTTEKIYFLGYMTRQLLLAHLGFISQTDRDSYINKRIDLCGTALNNLYRNYLNKLFKDMEKQVIREINNGSWRLKNDYENIINLCNIYRIIKFSTLENGIKRALSTGDFGIKNFNSNKVGVAQVLNRLNYVSFLSHIRRVFASIDKGGKLIAPRKLHNTYWGYFCVAETPEGHSVGVVKNLAYMTHITIHSDNTVLLEQVIPYIEPLPMDYYFIWTDDMVKVFVNGAWVGYTTNPIVLYQMLKRKKYLGIINVYTSIIFDYTLKEIRLCNDGGRLTRPILRVNDKTNKIFFNQTTVNEIKKKEISWEDLIVNFRSNHSMIEYIDPDEHEHSCVAMFLKDLKEAKSKLIQYTHCEIHPSTMFGILASCIPFPDHNQSPRNTYQCAQGKQAMGIPSTVFNKRMDKTSCILNNPNRPFVDTRIMDILNLNKIPCGMNLIVAIMSYSGYNQEDSIILNGGSIGRGMSAVNVLNTERDEDKPKRNGDAEIRCKPDKATTKKKKEANYDKLDERGLIPNNTFVDNRDVLIGKVNPIKGSKKDSNKRFKFEDCSKLAKTSSDTFVNNTITGRNGDGYNFTKVQLRTYRVPNIGDKFSSRHGQKGTVGAILPECDMPYTEDGLRPDIIINPHAIPSRMTIGQLKETLLGLLLVEMGLFGDGTSYGDLDVFTISEMLQKNGFHSNGDQIMYNGETGEQLQCSIFIGPVFYQRLKHMVNDKVHSRASGPRVTLTRQPQEGRSKDGGLRFGEMERDCMGAHGTARFMKDRMYDVSDKFSMYICKLCGSIAIHNDIIHSHLCRSCQNTTDFALVHIPYATKLLFQELAVMNISTRLLTESV
jgi:DNA-directed RNA polymerase II subunit RPB2